MYTLSELEEKGFKALDFRYFVLTTHYRKLLDFTLENLDSAKNAYQRLKNIISDLKDGKPLIFLILPVEHGAWDEPSIKRMGFSYSL